MSNQTQLQPIGEHASWYRVPPASLATTLQSWLLDPGSLTARLKRHCREFSVQVLNEGFLPITDAEREHLECTDDAHWVREVLLHCDGVPHVYARSVIPKKSLAHDENHLTELGTKPLGQVLFNDPSIHRDGFHIGSFACDSPTIVNLNALELNIQQGLWGRRSLFNVNQQPILVMEVFLPGAVAYQEAVAC